MSTTQREVLDNRTLVAQFIEEFWNKGNDAFANDVLSAGFQRHELGSGEVISGTAAFKKRAADIRAAFPDFHLTHHGLVSDNQRVGLCWKATGTHQGDFEGIAPTGKSVSIEGISIFCALDGQILEEFASWDRLKMLQQLGVLPE